MTKNKEIMMARTTRLCGVVAALLLACTPAKGRCEEARSAAKPDMGVAWDMASFAEIVKPMQHGMQGRLPLLLWNFPIPRGDNLLKLRENGSLRRAIDQMAKRGFVPTVEMGWQWSLPGCWRWPGPSRRQGSPSA